MNASPSVAFECSTFRASALENGRIRIELDGVEGRSPSNGGDQLYTKSEVAKRLGTSVRSVENWMKAKRHPLPFIRNCGRPKFRESDLAWWLSQGCSVASRRVAQTLGGIISA